MHDCFEIVGVPSDAPAKEIRQVFARRIRRVHPDFRMIAARGQEARPEPAHLAFGRGDASVDFVDMTSVTDRIVGRFIQGA